MTAFPWMLAPSTWSRYQLRHLGRLYGGGTPTKDDPRYWGGSIPWVSPKDMKARTISDAEDHVTELGVRCSATRLIPKGSLLIVVRSGILQRTIPVALLGREAALNQDMKAIVPNDKADVRFLVYWIDGLQNALLPLWRKEGATVESLDVELLRRAVLPLPRLGVQNAISEFLDRRTAAVDELIRKKERLIELLQEKRQALITQAVTKGLDPSGPMKDSGIEWIGRIPQNWQVSRGRFLFRELSMPPTEDDHVVTAFRNGQVTLRENRRVDGFMLAEKEIGYQHVRVGDLVLHSMDAFAGAIGISESEGKCTPEYVVLEPRDSNIFSPYYAHCLRWMAKQNFIFVICPSVRERAPRFRYETFKDVLLPLPPLEEQKRICEFIDTIPERHRAVAAKLERHIALLREYRQALITAAVTGQLDIPAEAA